MCKGSNEGFQLPVIFRSIGGLWEGCDIVVTWIPVFWGNKDFFTAVVLTSIDAILL